MVSADTRSCYLVTRWSHPRLSFLIYQPDALVITIPRFL